MNSLSRFRILLLMTGFLVSTVSACNNQSSSISPLPAAQLSVSFDGSVTHGAPFGTPGFTEFHSIPIPKNADRVSIILQGLYEGTFEIHVGQPSNPQDAAQYDFSAIMNSSLGSTDEIIIDILPTTAPTFDSYQSVAGGTGSLELAIQLLTAPNPTLPYHVAAYFGPEIGDRFEPNETFPTATTLVIPRNAYDHRVEGLTLEAGEIDYYKVYIDRGPTFSAFLQFPHDNGDLSIEMYDSFGVLVGSDDTSSTSKNWESATYTIPTADFYYVRVQGLTPNVATSYTLSFYSQLLAWPIGD